MFVVRSQVVGTDGLLDTVDVTVESVGVAASVVDTVGVLDDVDVVVRVVLV